MTATVELRGCGRKALEIAERDALPAVLGGKRRGLVEMTAMIGWRQKRYHNGVPPAKMMSTLPP
jgi:hypothetical protein